VSPPVWVVGLFGLAFACAIPLRLLLAAHMDPTIFLGLGEEKPIQTEYARRVLGDVSVRADAGHDGKFVFAQANDPWYLQPHVHAAVLDQPEYRARRMLFPAIAGGLGTLPPSVVVWSMLATNIVTLALGTVLASRLGLLHGVSSWIGLSVPLNLGLIYETLIDGGGVVAFVCCIAGVYAFMRGRSWSAALWFAAAALGRETMLLFAFGVLVLAWRTERKAAWQLVLVPAVAVAAWSAYVGLRLAGISGTGGAPENIVFPFTGLLEAARAWVSQPENLVLNGAILAIVLAFVVLGLRSRLPIAWGALPFVALAAVVSINVWLEPSDSTRVLAPVFTAAPFLLLVRARGTVRASERVEIQGEA
jgi:hypothetical protein